MKQIKQFLILALIGLVVVFTIQNVQAVEITFLLWTFEMRRAILIFLVLAAGFVIGWLARGSSRTGSGTSKPLA